MAGAFACPGHICRGQGAATNPVRPQAPRFECRTSDLGSQPRDDVTDGWHIRLDQHYLNTEAGIGARAKEQELADNKDTARRFVERLLDTKTDERNWRRGGQGENGSLPTWLP